MCELDLTPFHNSFTISRLCIRNYFSKLKTFLFILSDLRMCNWSLNHYLTKLMILVTITVMIQLYQNINNNDIKTSYRKVFSDYLLIHHVSRIASNLTEPYTKCLFTLIISYWINGNIQQDKAILLYTTFLQRRFFTYLYLSYFCFALQNKHIRVWKVSTIEN